MNFVKSAPRIDYSNKYPQRGYFNILYYKSQNKNICSAVGGQINMYLCRCIVKTVYPVFTLYIYTYMDYKC